MTTPPIRTITLGLGDEHPLTSTCIKQAAEILRRAQERYAGAGYEVQTLRLSTRPVFDDLAAWSSSALVNYVQELQHMLDDVGLAFCSLGTAQAARPGFPLERVDLIADLLATTSALNATVQLATSEHGLRTEAALPIARVMRRLAHETEEGFGNFRFAMLACAAAGCPFFPTAYHAGPASLSLGLQGVDVVLEALQVRIQDELMPVDLLWASDWVRAALVERAAPVVALGQALAQEHGLLFGGIDLSPAPLGDHSIATALEMCGYGQVGLEDAILGQRWEEGLVGAHQLLLYSAVCGTGLDTLPFPGDTAPELIAHLLLDVATLALRLSKPLSARLFPVPGRRAGERTTFTSPYLTNTLIRSIQ